MSDVTDDLLACHVEYELSRLRGDRAEALLEEWLIAAFGWLSDVKFGEVVTRAQIVGVIERYVIDLKVSGGIAELAGEMANVVFSSASTARTRVADICTQEDYEEFADKIVGLRGVQRELIRYVSQSPAFATLASRFLSSTFTGLLFGGRASDTGVETPGLMQLFGERLVPELEQRVTAALGRYFERHASRLFKQAERRLVDVLDPEWVRQIADEIYDAVSRLRLSEAAATFTPQDLEDFVVLGYEFWLRFRRTPYFSAVVAEVVDRLFTKYDTENLLAVMEDMGITQEMVVSEVKAFARPIVDHALRTGFAEQRIRAHLEPFYRSAAVAAIVAR